MKIYPINRINRNSIALYLRTLLAVIVGFFTSRIVLQVLGVTDYGIYGVVAGFMGLMAILNTSMAGSTTRFISYHLGTQGCDISVARTFGAARTVHIIIAGIVFVLAQTVGLWYVNHELNVPHASLWATNWIYQIAIISTIVSITQVPYLALIMSHERLTLYAWVEVVNVSLRLLCVGLLIILPADKLILYAVLTAAITIGITLYYRYYCRLHFPEAKVLPCRKKSVIMPMIRFSMQDLYGNGCQTARHEGIILILNRFFGVAINAATSLANTVGMAVSQLTASVLTAYQPGIFKAHAGGDFKTFNSLINRAVFVCGLLYLTMAVPLSYCIEDVLTLWLDDTPEWTATFCIYVIAGLVLMTYANVILTAVRATGRIAIMSFVSGTVYLLALPIAFFLLRYFPFPPLAYIVIIGSNFIVIMAALLILKREEPAFRCLRAIIAIAASVVGPAISYVVIHKTVANLHPGLGRLALACIISGIINTLYFIVVYYMRRKVHQHKNLQH